MIIDEPFDAIVIGSGFGGAVTACRLSEAGLNVCILERGRRYSSVDLPVLPDETFWPRTDDDHDERKLPDFTRAFWQLGQGLWELRDLGDLVVGQAAGFGGGSLIYANVHLRAPEQVFDAWPEAYRDGRLRNYYDLAAFMLDVEPVPAEMPKTVGLKAAARSLETSAGGDPSAKTRIFKPPLAVHFGPAGKNRFGAEQGSCDMRGECIFGCTKQAKNTLDLNYLHVAEEHGVEVRTMAEVTGIALASAGPRFTVTYRNHLKRGQSETAHAQHVFLCAGSVNTTELLLRCRDGGTLPISGRGLGTHFYPNADELGVVFGCKEEQETDRGPTITTAWVYDDGKKDGTWLMVQDGGLPAHLEPMLGLFRSPLWLQRNAFAKPGAEVDAGPVDPKMEYAALPQRVGFAALPVDSIVDLLTGLTGSAVASTLPLSHEVSRALVNFARGGRNLDRIPPKQQWSLCPTQLHNAADRVRESALADLALLAEPIVENFINTTAEKMPDGLIASIREMGLTQFDIGNRRESELRRWAMQAGIQGIWGSQAGLLGSLASVLSPMFAPAPKEIVQRVASLLRWALDYRGGDGHSTVLLVMGRDSKPARLELVYDDIPVGSRVTSKERRGASGILVHQSKVNGSKSVLVVSNVEGSFQMGDAVFADTRPVGICKDVKREEVEINSGEEKGKGDHASLWVLSVETETGLEDPRRFRTDSYREGQWQTEAMRASRAPVKNIAKTELRAVLPEAHETPERSTQELLLRDLAQSFGGQLRTSPLHPFLGRRITVHAQGGCPMAERAGDGVTKPSGEVFGCDGLYVMDAAAFPTPVGVNPSATIAAVAEWKVGEFLRQWVQQASGRPEKVAAATAWTESTRPAALKEAEDWAKTKPWLDPIGDFGRQSVEPSKAPTSKPIGIEFDEIMTGSHRRWSVRNTPAARYARERFIQTELRASIGDLAAFLAADRANADREFRVTGKVIFEIDNFKGESEVLEDNSRIWLRSAVDNSGNQTRTIEYLLEFEVGQERYQLDGIKTIRDDARFDVWEDTTTLCFVLRKRPASDLRQFEGPVPWTSDEPDRWGVLRLPAAQFFGLQVPSLSATNINNDPARQVWAISTFASFFLSHLVDVYLPALDRVADIGKRVLGRGHV